MLSLRCKLMVKQEFKKLGIRYGEVYLGVIELRGAMSVRQHHQLKTNLLAIGLELMDDKRDILVEQIVAIINDIIQHDKNPDQSNYSEVISETVGYNYTNLSKVFSSEKGITIQQYIINRKIERVKELLQNEELNLTEISRKLHYSSVGHLSNQFKKVTGFSPKEYEQKKRIREITHDTGYV